MFPRASGGSVSSASAHADSSYCFLFYSTFWTVDIWRSRILINHQMGTSASQGTSRRHLLAVASLAVGVSLLHGQPAGFRSATAQDSTWRVEDGLRLAGSVNGPASLDPALSRDLSVNFIMAQLYRGLMSLDADLIPQPCLAASVETLEQGLAYRFILRPEAAFHDGRPISADDIHGSLSRALNPAIAGGLASNLAAITYLGDIVGSQAVMNGEAELLEGVQVEDEATVLITLQQRSRTFLMRLASVPASIVDMQQVKVGEPWPEHPNGSGPFALESWVPGQELILKAADTWWEGKPALLKVIFGLGANAVQPLNLYQAGEADIVVSAPPDQVALIRDPASNMPAGELVETDLFAIMFIALGNQGAPLDDIHVRRALQLVFSAERYVRGRYGEAVSSARGLVPPGMLGVDWPVPAPVHDIDAARHELDQSRYGSADNVPPILIYAAEIEPVEALRDVAAEALGLTVEAIEVPFPEFVAGLAAKSYPSYAIYWGADYPDPESLLTMLFGPDSADNYTGYVNDAFTDLLAQSQELDGAARIEALVSANQLLVDDAAIIPVYHPRAYTLIRAGVDGVVMTPMGMNGLESISGAS